MEGKKRERKEEEDGGKGNQWFVAALLGVLGVGIIAVTYGFFKYFSSKKLQKSVIKELEKEEEEEEEEIKNEEKEGEEELEETPSKAFKTPDVTEEELLEAKMDTLVEPAPLPVNIPKGSWQEDEPLPWENFKEDVYKRCFCGKTSKDVKMTRCSACKSVYYCSRDHQKQGWTENGHKHMCPKFKEIPNKTFQGIKRLLVEASPPLNNGKFASEDALAIALKALYDKKYDSENDKVILLKEAGRLLWMLAQLKFQGKQNAKEFEKLMRISLDFLRNAWNMKEVLLHDLEVKSQTEWLLGEHYMNIDQGKGLYFMYHSVIDMLAFHSKLTERLKIEETKKLLQIWCASLINMLMMGDCVDLAEKLLAEILPVTKKREDVEWEIQIVDFECLISGYKVAKEKIGTANFGNNAFKEELQKCYEQIRNENPRFEELFIKLQNNPPQNQPLMEQQMAQFQDLMRNMAN